MANETLKTIKSRRSIRAYRPEQIKDEEIKAIAEAGLYAPSGGGQAWYFSVVQNKEILERINALAKQYAAGSGLPWLEELGKDPNFHSTYAAPTVIFVSAAEGVCAVPDTSAATQNMLLAAESLGVGSCWGYFAPQAFSTEEGEALKKELQIPEGYNVYTSVMLGYAAGEKPEAEPRKPNLVAYIG